MIRMMLYGEGKTDQGYKVYQDGEYNHTDGVIQILLQKLINNETLDMVTKTRHDIRNFVLLPNPHKYSHGVPLKAKKLSAMAKLENCEYMAYHRDEDNNGFEAIYEQVKKYFTVAEEKGIRCLAVVPMHMIESWLLSDAGAFPYKPSAPSLPREPEKTWGKPEADTHPKKYLARVLKQYHLNLNAETCYEIAGNSSVKIVRERCPTRFGRLCDDVEALFPS